MAIDTYHTYLTFPGNCREAFEFYRSVFGGDFDVFATFGEGPSDMDVPDAQKHLVMHVSLPIGGGVLMGSDAGPQAPTLNAGNNFSLSVATGGKDESDALLAKLSAGGAVTMPMGETFWGAYFGMCTDKFGINWMVVYEMTEGR